MHGVDRRGIDINLPFGHFTVENIRWCYQENQKTVEAINANGVAAKFTIGPKMAITLVMTPILILNI